MKAEIQERLLREVAELGEDEPKGDGPSACRAIRFWAASCGQRCPTAKDPLSIRRPPNLTRGAIAGCDCAFNRAVRCLASLGARPHSAHPHRCIGEKLEIWQGVVSSAPGSPLLNS